VTLLENSKEVKAEFALALTSENGSTKRQKGTFVPSRPTLL
jgi:hypothetical protein